MKPNPKQTLHTAHWTTQQARQVADRYMQGLTSVAEEQALAQFLKTPEGAAAEFDALRAVFAYLDMGRIVHAKASTPTQNTSAKATSTQVTHRLTLSPRLLASAAAIAVLIVGGWLCWDFLPTLQRPSLGSENIAIAYVGGKPITDAETVHLMMEESLQMMSESDEVDIIQEQLSDMFNTLSEEE